MKPATQRVLDCFIASAATAVASVGDARTLCDALAIMDEHDCDLDTIIGALVFAVYDAHGDASRTDEPMDRLECFAER